MSTGALAPIGLQQFCNDAGVPLAGGSILTTLTGTTTPASTFNNIDLAVGHLNANPVVLDSAGRATIFIPRGTGYRFTISDSAGTVVDTRNGILVYDDSAVPTPATSITVPPGTILPFGGAAVPVAWQDDYFLCDGASYLRADEPDLFAVIGTNYGSIDGTHFNVPDGRGRFLFGMAASAGTGDALGETFGAIDHVHTGPSHTHATSGATASDGDDAVTGSTAAGGTEAVTGYTGTGAANLTISTELAGNPGGGGPFVTDVSDGGHTHDASNLAGPSHTHAAGTLTGPAHTHGAGTLAADAAGTGNSGTANPPGLVCNFIVKR